MSWRDLQPYKPQYLQPKAPVRVGVFQRDDAPSRAYVMVEADTLKLIGTGADRYSLAIGNLGENKHQLKIAFDKLGGFMPTEFGKSKGAIFYRFMLPPLDNFPECKVAAQGTDFKHAKADKALIVDLPPWGWDQRIKLDVERAAGIR